VFFFFFQLKCRFFVEIFPDLENGIGSFVGKATGFVTIG